MSLPSIAIINFTSNLREQDVQDVIRAINRQVVEDYVPIWGAGRLARLHAADFDPSDPDSLSEERVAADSVIYLVDQPNVPGALGFHSINSSEIPVGFVFEDLGDWTITLSHEVLELIVDPTANVFVPGPDPRSASDAFTLLHAYETCDAVERSTYVIDGVEVSNFVTPQYFFAGDAGGTRNDFLGVGVDSFGVTDGSHLGVINLDTLGFETILGSGMPSSKMAARRQEQFAHDRPGRHDEEFTAMLEKYNEDLPAKGCRPLKNLRGLTRLARYESAAAMFKQTRQPAQSPPL